MATTLAQLFVEFRASTDKFNADLRAAQREVREFDKQMKPTTKLLDDFGGMATRAGTALTVGLTAPIAAIAGMGVQFNAMQEQAQIAFSTMLGSGEKAKAFLSELKDFAAKTPFEFPDLVRAAQRLMAMGFEAKNVKPLLTAVGDAVAGLGGGAAEIDRVTLALGQMQGRGKVATQEMNQLTEVGIPAWKILADSMGITETALRSLVEKGAVPAGEAVNALVAGMTEKFGGMTEKQAQTFSGLISTIKDEARFLAGELTEGLFAALKGPLETVTNLLHTLRESMSGWSDESKAAIAIVAGALAVGGPLLIGFGMLATAVSSIITLFAAGGPFMVAVSAVGAILTGPVGLAVAIGAVVAALAVFVSDNETVRAALTEAWAEIKEAVGGVLTELLALWKTVSTEGLALWKEWGPLIKDYLAIPFATAIPIIKEALVLVLTLFKDAIKLITGVLQVFAGALTGDWSKFCTGIKNIWSALWDAIKAILTAPLKAAAGAVEGFTSSVTGFFRDMYDKVVGHSFVPDMVEGIKSEMERLGDVMVKPVQTATNSVMDSFKGMLDGVIGHFTDKIPIVGGLLKQLGESLAMKGLTKVLRGTAVGGLLGLGGAGAGAGVAGAGAAGAGGVGLGAVGALATNPITLAVAGALAAGLAIKHFVGGGRRKANEFVQGAENPFARNLSAVVDSFDSMKKAGSLTLEQAQESRDAVGTLWSSFLQSGAQFSAQGKTQAKVVNQSLQHLSEVFGPNLQKIFEGMDATIAELQKAATANDPEAGGSQPGSTGLSGMTEGLSDAISGLGDWLKDIYDILDERLTSAAGAADTAVAGLRAVSAGIPQTGVAQSASTKFAAAVDKLVPAFDSLVSAVTRVGSSGVQLTVENEFKPSFTFYGVPESLEREIRETIEPQIMKDLQNNTRGMTAALVTILRNAQGGVVSTIPVTA